MKRNRVNPNPNPGLPFYLIFRRTRPATTRNPIELRRALFMAPIWPSFKSGIFTGSVHRDPIARTRKAFLAHRYSPQVAQTRVQNNR